MKEGEDILGREGGSEIRHLKETNKKCPSVFPSSPVSGKE